MDDLVNKIDLYCEHPSAMVEEMFGYTPDGWQHKVYEAFPHNKMLAMQSCTGAGKTHTLAMLAINFLITRFEPKIGVISINKDNLESNLWRELALLYNQQPYLKKCFEMTATSIRARERPGTWCIEPRTWAKKANAEEIGETLKGHHAPYVMWVADEMGSAPAAILPTMEAIFSGSPIEARIVIAGNPMTRSGVLYRACVRNRRYWHVTEITADPDDPMRTPRVSIEHARQQIQEWGASNPWVQVNIFGRFPDADINALISEDDILAAMKRSYREYDLSGFARVMGVDVAQDGLARSAICRRRGLQVWPFRSARNLDATAGAAWVQRLWTEFEADACFVDATGGFGAGWCSALRGLNREPVGIKFSSSAHDPGQFYNKRTEMSFDAIQWIKNGGALPPDAYGILTAAPAITYTSKGDRLLLEEKEQVLQRIGNVPHVEGCMDEWDSFILSFAEPITRAPTGLSRSPNRSAATEYKPFADLGMRSK